MIEQLRLLVCQNFGAEAAALVAAAGRPDVRTAVFPAHCTGPTPDAEPVGRLVAGLAEAGCAVILLGSYCLHGLAEAKPGVCAAERVRVVTAPRCLEFVAAAQVIDAEIAAGAYLLTPGWLRRWRRTMTAWGFDRPTARAFFAEFSRKLVLLDTGVGGDPTPALRELAEFLALPCAVRAVGLELWRRRLAGIIQEWRRERVCRKAIS